MIIATEKRLILELMFSVYCNVDFGQRIKWIFLRKSKTVMW